MPMKLYAHQNNYKTHKALIAAKYAGLDIEKPPQGNDPQTGKIPVLETDQGCIFTSIAIARYLCRIRRDVGLYGQSLIESGMIDSWVEFCTHELEIPLCTWVFPLKGIFPEVPEATAQAKEDVKRTLDVLNNHLLHNTYMVGHQITLADICICCALSDAMTLAFDSKFLAPLGNLMRWYSLVSAQPEFVAVLGQAASAGAAPAKKGGDAKKNEAKSPKAAPAPKKDAAPKKEAKSPKAAPAAAPAAAGASDAQVDAVGNEIRLLKEKLKGEGLSGKKINENAEVKALVAKLQELKSGAAEAPKPAAKKEAAPKADKKSKDASAGGEEKPKSAEEIEADRKKQLKTCTKEGGKRGVEIEGAADMGGLQFFCTSVDAPAGDLDMLKACLEAMNAKSDPTEEERKGGSGHIGKMIFSAGTEQLALAAYVPEEKQKELSCEEWIKAVLALHGGKLESTSKSVCIGVVKADSNKNVFPLKIREPMILEANNFLRKLGLFPEDKDDSDEMVFGDDDFPSM